jgi:hypothetical protein
MTDQPVLESTDTQAETTKDFPSLKSLQKLKNLAVRTIIEADEALEATKPRVSDVDIAKAQGRAEALIEAFAIMSEINVGEVTKILNRLAKNQEKLRNSLTADKDSNELGRVIAKLIPAKQISPDTNIQKTLKYALDCACLGIVLQPEDIRKYLDGEEDLTLSYPRETH